METTFKCQYCGKDSNAKGELFHSQGQLNLHEYHCKNKQQEPLKEEPKKGAAEKGCHHAWRLLSERQDIEFKARLQGYKEVCSKCQELR